jgi:hypothetical protein
VVNVSINETARALARVVRTAAFLICAATLAAAAAGPTCAAAAPGPRALRGDSRIRLAQFGSGEDQPNVAPGDVEKYVNVYKAMQANHTLTVQQAAARQGLTVNRFRTLEDRIERNDALRTRVRKELRAVATPAPTPGE